MGLACLKLRPDRVHVAFLFLSGIQEACAVGETPETMREEYYARGADQNFVAASAKCGWKTTSSRLSKSRRRKTYRLACFTEFDKCIAAHRPLPIRTNIDRKSYMQRSWQLLGVWKLCTSLLDPPHFPPNFTVKSKLPQTTVCAVCFCCETNDQHVACVFSFSILRTKIGSILSMLWRRQAADEVSKQSGARPACYSSWWTVLPK